MPLGISAGTGAAIAGGLSAAGTVAGGLIQSGNTAAAQKQANWIRQLAVGQSQQSYNQNVQNLTPYSTGGIAATGAESDLLGLNGPDAATAAMTNFQASPGYQYQLQQGLRAVDAGAASQDMLRSGATLKAEQKYGSDLANLDFGNYFSRLNALSGQGFNAATGLDTASNNLTNAILGVGSSAISGATGAANAQNSIVGNVASGLGNQANSLLNNNAFLQLIGGSSNYGNAAPDTPGLSASGNPVMTGFAPSYSPGQAGVGGFVAPAASKQF